MANSSLSASFIIVAAALFVQVRRSQAIECPSYENHPAYHSSMQPTLIRCWSYMKTSRIPWNMYLAKYTLHRYAPVSDPNSLVYDGLDWFWTTSGHLDRPDFIKLHFNRHARVYLIIPMHRLSKMTTPSLGSWKPMGEVKLVKGEGRPFGFGVHQKYEGESFLYERAYIFSMMGKDVELPHQQYVTKYLKGFEIPKGHPWIAMIGERDGSPWSYPPNPPSVRDTIRPNRRCPDELHDLWVTPNTDDSDADTRGKVWKTWHPAWDPIYWCAYDHEHGSASVALMGYWPKYDLTAWKNGREKENNEGFKNLIMEVGDYKILYMVHMQTSSLRRLKQRWHSILFVVMHARTREIVVEITHKGDFGFLSARIGNGLFMPITSEDAKMMKEMFTQPHRRSVNIIDEKNLDRRLEYRSPKHTMMMGVYEDWTTVPLGGAEGRAGNLRIDVTRSATGVRSFSRMDEKVYLGHSEKGVFYRQAGQARLLLAPKFEFSSKNCERTLGARLPSSGVFYTNAKGDQLKDGPGPDAIRQYIKPGFSLSFSGKFRAVDSWSGLLSKDSDLEVDDLGYGLDPDKN